jgi:hypothetical protein
MKNAILVDAGLLKRKLGSQAEPLDINGVCTFLDALRGEGHAAVQVSSTYLDILHMQGIC